MYISPLTSMAQSIGQLKAQLAEKDSQLAEARRDVQRQSKAVGLNLIDQISDAWPNAAQELAARLYADHILSESEYSEAVRAIRRDVVIEQAK